MKQTSVILYIDGQGQKIFFNQEMNISTFDFAVDAMQYAFANKINGRLEVIENGKKIYQTIIDFYD